MKGEHWGVVYYVCAVNQTYIESFRHLPFLQTLVAIMGKLFFCVQSCHFGYNPTTWHFSYHLRNNSTGVERGRGEEFKGMPFKDSWKGRNYAVGNSTRLNAVSLPNNHIELRV